jgi:hypothetical protein
MDPKTSDDKASEMVEAFKPLADAAAHMKVEFEPATVGKSGRRIASGYTADGSFPKRHTQLPLVRTVGDLKALLAQLPDALPVYAGFTDAAQPRWYNVGDSDEHLEIEEPPPPEFDEDEE